MTAPTLSDAEVHNDHFDGWAEYDGLLVETKPTDFPTRVFGFSGFGERELDLGDSTFGYVVDGQVRVHGTHGAWDLSGGRFFAGQVSRLELEAARVVACSRIGYRALPVNGGPIEALGRLRYIDGCSDTLLIPPAVQGEPCLNLLHFPPSIEQTFHTHPSIRAGVVARGTGWCETPAGRTPLVAGMLFSIHTDGVHRFVTSAESSMDVIAYHPDSDWGPTHEDHPMVNRTWVDGAKVDNSADVHQRARVIDGFPFAGC